jgi:hypothetical protein
MSTKSYRILGNTDARTSRLHGEIFATHDEARAALARVLPEVVEVPVDAGNEQAWLVYTGEEEAERDQDGHLATASIETVTISEATS